MKRYHPIVEMKMRITEPHPIGADHYVVSLDADFSSNIALGRDDDRKKAYAKAAKQLRKLLNVCEERAK